MKLASRSLRTVLAATLVSAACAPAEPPQLTETQRAAAEEIGGAAADQLASTLIGQLTTAMESGGPAGAIDFCSTRAMPLTDEVNASLEGLEVKRTTRRLRNPANAADSLEDVALAWFEAQKEQGGVFPSSWVQDTGDEVRYYRPLVANGLCIQCHGQADALNEEVRSILAERYPGDDATGYGAGDLRGLIRVSILRARLTPQP